MKTRNKFSMTVVFACAMFAVASTTLARERSRPLKVLAIGNSFSLSLMAQLPACARSLPDVELDFATLVIGGCSLERHWNNVERSCDLEFRPYGVHWSFASAPDKKNPPFGDAVKNGRANIPQMLQAVRWDIVTIQQASHASWDEKTYQPYADNLLAKIRELAPQAEIRIQQTWAYCNADERICADATPGKPGTWGINQQGMHDGLTAAYDKLAGKHGLKVIPSGDAVSLYRKALPVTFNPPTKEQQSEFNDGELPDMGGEPVGSYRWGKGPSWNKKAKDYDVHKLRCDSIHLNREGEYLQACTWLAALFDDDLSRLSYKPDFLSEKRAALMRKCAVEAVKARTSSGRAVHCSRNGVALRNVRIVCRGGGDTAAERTRPVPEVAGKYPDAHMFGCILPAYGLYARHVDGLQLDNVSFPLAPGTSDRREPMVFDDVCSEITGSSAMDGATIRPSACGCLSRRSRRACE